MTKKINHLKIINEARKQMQPYQNLTDIAFFYHEAMEPFQLLEMLEEKNYTKEFNKDYNNNLDLFGKEMIYVHSKSVISHIILQETFLRSCKLILKARLNKEKDQLTPSDLKMLDQLGLSLTDKVPNTIVLLNEEINYSDHLFEIISIESTITSMPSLLNPIEQELFYKNPNEMTKEKMKTSKKLSKIVKLN